MPSNDSFINANQLTPQELSAKIKYLLNNEKEYSNYFEFKKREMSKNFEKMALMSYTHPNVVCRLCDYYYQRFV
jgi:hypothetical protein